MKKVVLFCAAGMSTSMLVNRMKKSCETQNLDYDIAAYPISEAKIYGPDADIILLGPQVKYKLNDTKAQFADKPVEPINMTDYGMMNGDNVVAFVKKVLGD